MDTKEIIEIVDEIRQMNKTTGEAISWLLGIVKGADFNAKKMFIAM